MCGCEEGDGEEGDGEEDVSWETHFEGYCIERVNDKRYRCECEEWKFHVYSLVWERGGVFVASPLLAP